MRPYVSLNHLTIHNLVFPPYRKREGPQAGQPNRPSAGWRNLRQARWPASFAWTSLNHFRNMRALPMPDGGMADWREAQRARKPAGGIAGRPEEKKF